jgi:hypothetical protein
LRIQDLSADELDELRGTLSWAEQLLREDEGELPLRMLGERALFLDRAHDFALGMADLEPADRESLATMIQNRRNELVECASHEEHSLRRVKAGEDALPGKSLADAIAFHQERVMDLWSASGVAAALLRFLGTGPEAVAT